MWTHTLDALDACARRRPTPRGPAPAGEDVLVLRWALLLHDVAKPETLSLAADGRPTFHGHEILGEKDWWKIRGTIFERLWGNPHDPVDNERRLRVMAGFMAFLAEVGAERDRHQQAKTRWALEYYTARLNQGASGAARGASTPKQARPTASRRRSRTSSRSK